MGREKKQKKNDKKRKSSFHLSFCYLKNIYIDRVWDILVRRT